MPSSSFYADGETYDAAVVTSNDKPASTTPSQAPSSFFSNGGVVGQGTVVSNETGPGPRSNTPASFFTDGAVVASETVESNDTVPSTTHSQAPSGFFQNGNIYDYLNTESEVVALLQQLAATTTTNASNSAASETAAAQQAANAATSAAQAATAVQGAAGTATPIIDGTATVGTSPKWAHEDHVHPKDPTLASVSYVDTKVASVVNSAPATLDTLNELATALGDDPNFATTVSTQIGLKADKTYVDAQNAALNTAKADKTYVDTQDTALSNSVFGGQCKLVWVNATTLKLIPWNGNKIKHLGKIYSIPAAGITITNSGLTASTLFFCYLTDPGTGILQGTWGTGGYVMDTAVGNEGIAVHYQSNTLTLVGMVYTNASSQFADNTSWRGVRSWFNDPGIRMGQTGSADFSCPIGVWGEDTTMRLVAAFWANEQIELSGYTISNNNGQGNVNYVVPYMQGNTAVGLPAFTYQMVANYYAPIPFNSSLSFSSDTPVTLSIAGQISGGANNWSYRTLTVMTNRK